MNIQLCSRTLFLFCFTFVCLVNIFILSSVYINRHGDIDALAVLTERELRISDFSRKENSGMNLRLVWRTLGDKTPSYYKNLRPNWLTSQKMKELGFNLDSYRLSKDKKDFFKSPLCKEVYIVLENNGPAYQQALTMAEKQVIKAQKAVETNPEDKKLNENLSETQKQLQGERTGRSRLFAIDAGLDADALRKKYSNKALFLIVKGTVRPTFANRKVTGYISELTMSHIHVPLEHRPFFDNFSGRKTGRDKFNPPRFAVNLAFGSRLEPWIVSVRSLDESKTQ